MTSGGRWRPTRAHVRSVLGAGVLCVVAVLARRPDLVVIAAPLATIAVWGAANRPAGRLEVDESVSHALVREGDSVGWSVHISPTARVEFAAARFAVPDRVDLTPANGTAVGQVSLDGCDLAAEIRPTRWGPIGLQPAHVVASTAWNAFQYELREWSSDLSLLVLPQPSRFDALAQPTDTPGLIGLNRSPRYGSGSEFATIRPFQPGDRLKRVHWRESLRSSELYVTDTWADTDRHVVLMVDAFDDVGRSGGIDGAASSLDVAVRAAAAVAEHYCSVGDRVALVTFSSNGVRRVPPGSGHRHLRRILDALARTEAANLTPDTGRVPGGTSGRALHVMISPLLSDGSLRRLGAIADQGHSIVAIDCLPSDLSEHATTDPYERIAWRIKRLQRDGGLRRVAGAGIPVVAWRGPGSLDQVLKGQSRRKVL